MFRNILANVRAKSPLVHNITNYVTVNDCANIVLACGASPIMADDAAEVEDITSLCAGLNLNIGTLNSRTIPSMLLAGHTANRLGRPVVLDPVGAGASHLRTETALRLLREVKFTVIRGNISEIRTLAAGSGTTKGVDANTADKVTDETLDKTVAFAKAFAARTGAVVAVTDRAWTGRETLRQQVEDALKGGVTCVQLREKELDDAAFLQEAMELSALCRSYGVPFIINDNVEIAIKCHADGIHVGQEDMAAADVRAKVGPDGGILCGQPGQASGSRCCSCLRHGPCGRSSSQPPVQAGRQRHLPQLHHRRDLQHDPRTARGRSTL